jgi:hypothetical protein
MAMPHWTAYADLPSLFVVRVYGRGIQNVNQPHATTRPAGLAEWVLSFTYSRSLGILPNFMHLLVALVLLGRKDSARIDYHGCIWSALRVSESTDF